VQQARTSSAILTLVSTRAREFCEELSGIRDGLPGSVHDARVACRRLRELLPLLGDNPHAVQARNVLTEAGRRLGIVRDLDVMANLLTTTESTIPAAALAIASARRSITASLRKERRLLIKAIEDLDFGRVAKFRKRPRVGWPALRAVALGGEAAWSRMLRDRVQQRAEQLHSAVDHAAGVYFPNRLHGVRTAAKKLRYAVEVATNTGVWSPPHLLNDLRKIQSILGDMHDTQVLLDQLQTAVDETVPHEEVAVLTAVLASNIVRLHEEYLRRRDRLLAIVRACERFSAGRGTRRLILAAARPLAAASAAIAVPAALVLLERKARPSPTQVGKIYPHAPAV
jgi:CHAD domain-containing protein